MTYEQIKDLVNGKSLPISAENENGENVIISEGKTSNMHFYETQTAQKNDCVRINTYYQNGVTEETFEK